MKYALVLEFLCEIYRKEPRARIFLNDQLLDEFFIEQNVETSNYNNDQHILKPTPRCRVITSLKEVGILKPKIYQLEIPKEYDNLNIKIEIENNDNNYTNGFMTKYTVITLKHLYLIPLNINLIERLRKRKRKKQISDYYAWWSSDKHGLIDLLPNTNWREKEKIINFLSGQRIGTNGIFTCELRKKYGFYLHKDISPTYIIDIGVIGLIHYLIDKYSEHEN
jgi:hypothetical protein